MSSKEPIGSFEAWAAEFVRVVRVTRRPGLVDLFEDMDEREAIHDVMTHGWDEDYRAGLSPAETVKRGFPRLISFLDLDATDFERLREDECRRIANAAWAENNRKWGRDFKWEHEPGTMHYDVYARLHAAIDAWWITQHRPSGIPYECAQMTLPIAIDDLVGLEKKPRRYDGPAGMCEQAAATLADICSRFEAYYGEECLSFGGLARADIVEHLRHARARLMAIEERIAAKDVSAKSAG